MIRILIGDASDSSGGESAAHQGGEPPPCASRYQLSRLVVEALPSTLQGMQQFWLTIVCAPEAACRTAMPLLVQLHVKPSAQLDLCVVRQELLQGCFNALSYLAQEGKGKPWQRECPTLAEYLQV